MRTDFKMLFVYRRPFKNNWFFVVNTRNKLIWSFSRHCFVLEFIKETCVTAWRHEICRKLGSSRSKVKHMIKETQWKFKITFSLHLSFFVIFLFFCFVCLLLLFFIFIFSFSSDIRFKRTLSLVYSRHEGGNLSSGNKLHVTVSWMRYVHLCHYTTHIQKYNETLTNCNKSNQMSVRLPYLLADTPLLRLYTQSLALFVLKPESRTWRRYFQNCIEKSFFVSHFFFRAFKLDLQYNWSNDLYHLRM